MKNKVAIVTGAGRGIGKAIAFSLAHAGADVVVSARTESEINSVAREIEGYGRRAIAVKADVPDEVDVKSLISKTIGQFGKIDILVNNAGIGMFAKVEELPIHDFDAMWTSNIRGVFLCTRAVIPYMTKQKSGDIINISSLAGRNAFIGGAGYCATKWALIGFSQIGRASCRERV